MAERQEKRAKARKRRAKVLAAVKRGSPADATPAIPSRLQKFLAIADETLGPEVRQRSVIDVQPVFQPPKPPRLKTPKPPQRPVQPAPPPLTLPRPPKAPKPLSSLPKRSR